jgi:hypothetical protein
MSQNENLPPIKAKVSGCLGGLMVSKKPSEGVSRLAQIGHQAIMLKAKMERGVMQDQSSLQVNHYAPAII